MRTADLIATIAADPRPRGPALGARFALALAAGALVSALAFFSMVGLRHDFGAAIYTVRFDWKFVDTIALALPTGLLAWRVLRPGAGTRWLALALLVPLAALGGSVAMELMTVPPHLWLTRLVGTNARHCLTLIPLMSIPPLGALLLAMRSGAPAHPRLAGALAGLLSAGIAATIYATNCPDDSPLFVVTWYTIATALVTGAGALLGGRLLRW